MTNAIGSQQTPTRVLAKAGGIVDVLAAENGISPAEIADMCDIPRSSAYRILDGLINVDLVESNSDVSYSLSLDWLDLADAARRSLTEWAQAPHLLREMTGETGLTSFLTVINGEETVCVEYAQGRGIDALILRPGGTLPFFAGAAGRVALAYSDESIAEAYLSKAPFEGYNDNSLATESALREDMKLVREQGYALSNEDVTIGVGSIGVPIFEPAGEHVIAALSIGGFIDAVLPRQGQLAETLHRYADLLAAQRLG